MTGTESATDERVFAIFKDGGFYGENPDGIEQEVLGKAHRFFGRAADVEFLRRHVRPVWPPRYYAELVSVGVYMRRPRVEPIGTKVVVPGSGTKGNTRKEIEAKMVAEARPEFVPDANLHAEIKLAETNPDAALDGFLYCVYGKVFQVG